MRIPPISNDDIEDVCQLSDELEEKIYEILSDNDRNIAMSAMMSAFISTLLSQCQSMKEVYYYRRAFYSFLEDSIEKLKKDKFP